MFSLLGLVKTLLFSDDLTSLLSEVIGVNSLYSLFEGAADLLGEGLKVGLVISISELFKVGLETIVGFTTLGSK